MAKSIKQTKPVAKKATTNQTKPVAKKATTNQTKQIETQPMSKETAPVEAVATKAAPKSYTKEEMKQMLQLLRVEGSSTKEQISKALGRPFTAILPMRKRLIKALGADKVPNFKITRSGFGARGISDADLASFLEDDDI